MPECWGAVQTFLLYGFLINTGLLLLWFVLFAAMRGVIYRLHSRWFPMPEDTFVVVHYSLMGAFKLLNALLFFVPWCVLILLDGHL